MKSLQFYLATIALFLLSLSLLLFGQNPDWISPVLPFAVVLTLAGFAWFFLPETVILRTGPGRLNNETYLIFFLFILWLTVFPRAIYSVYHLPGSFWTPCFSLSNSFNQVECLIHSAYNQNYGLRVFSSLTVAFIVGLLGFFSARSGKKYRKVLWISIVAAALIHNFAGLIMKGLGEDQLVPWLFRNDWGRERFTFLFSNPGWIWPWLVPALSLSFYLTVTTEKKITGYLFGFLPLIISSGAFLTQQRGGFVLILGSFLIFIFFSTARKHRLLFLASVLLALLIIMALVFWPDLVTTLADYAGVEWKRKPLSVSFERLEIWESAFLLFKRHPFTGSGYASWYLEITRMARQTGLKYVFDTAHNHFVQLFVELGLIQGSAILISLVWIAWRAYVSLKQIRGGLLLFTMALFGTMLAMLVQEIDYPMPVQFGFALFWGSLCGVLSSDEYVAQSNSDFLRFRYVRPAGLAVLLTGLMLWPVYFFWMGRGVFSFEGLPEIPDTPMIRWLGRKNEIPAYAGSDNEVYAVYKLTFPRPIILRRTRSYTLEWEGRSATIEMEKGKSYYLPLNPGGRFLPVLNSVVFERNYIHRSRILGAQLVYPPVYSDIALFMSSGTGEIILEKDGLFWRSKGYFELRLGSHTTRFITAPPGCLFMKNGTISSKKIEIRAGEVESISGRCN